MSDIKFRAWDKANLNMFYGQSGFHFEKDGCVYINVIQANFGAYNDPVIMQFTGLHDKYGKEIFEGDIVRVTGESLDEDALKEIGVVMYQAGAFLISFSKENVLLAGFAGPLQDEIKEGLLYCVVIGNIYQQPALIIKGAVNDK